MRFQLTEERKREAARILKRYPVARSAVLPILWLVQDQEGFVSTEAAASIAEMVGAGAGEVEEVASFYPMIRRRPGPLHVITTCRGTICGMKGESEVERHIRERLGIEGSGVSVDGRFGLEVADCLGLCDRSPAIMVGDECFCRLTLERVDDILRGLGANI